MMTIPKHPPPQKKTPKPPQTIKSNDVWYNTEPINLIIEIKTSYAIWSTLDVILIC